MLETLFVVMLIGFVWAWIKINNQFYAGDRRITRLESRIQDLLGNVKTISRSIGLSTLDDSSTLRGVPPTAERFARLETKVEQLALDLAKLKSGISPKSSMEEAQPVAVAEVSALSQSEETSVLQEEMASTVSQPQIAPTPSDKEVEIPTQDQVPAPSKLEWWPALTESTRQSPRVPKVTFDWESFTGIKLFAWLGGLALFLGALFFVKYSIEHDLISPLLRVVLGAALGLTSVAFGMRIRNQGYLVTAQALCASGLAILYSSIFAASSFYHLINSGLAFLLMALVTVAAFLVAVALDSKYVAILGMAGGFLTPPLFSTGVDRPLELFSYIALLDVGLAALALKKRWKFLLSLSAFGTLFTQLGWTASFFEVTKAMTGIAIYSSFPILFTGLYWMSRRFGKENFWTLAPALILPLCSMGFAGYLLSFPQLSHKPGLVFTFLFLMDAVVALVAFMSGKARGAHLVAGGLAFMFLLIWTTDVLTLSLLPMALVFFLIFAALHGLYPVVWHSRYPEALPLLWETFFPVLMLIPILTYVARQLQQSYLVWIFVLLINLVSLPACILVANTWMVILSMMLTFAIGWAWLSHLDSVHGLSGLLFVLGGFSLVFYAIGLVLEHKKGNRTDSTGDGSQQSMTAKELLSATYPPQLLRLPALSGLLPFLLIMSACIQLPLVSPAPVFGLGLLLTVLLLALVIYLRADEVSIVALGSVMLLLTVWQFSHFDSTQPFLTLPWYGVFLAVFFSFPFLFHQQMKTRPLPWIVSASAGPALFYILYRATLSSWSDSYIGLLPAGLAVVYLTAVLWLKHRWPRDSGIRTTLLAIFGAVTLLFISLIVPVQFEKEWITLGWAIEGLALVWYFRRVPHPGLKFWGAALLVVAFVRLALNPDVLDYYTRTGVPLLNWYMYGYGVVACCCFLAARLWRPAEETLLDKPAAFWFSLKGTILLFLLVNIEIADYFSAGNRLTFEFSGNFAQDMTYSLAWAIFAFFMFLVGVGVKSKSARFGSLGLLLVTTIKVFLHDLWRLGQLYRVASLVGLAVFLIVVSFLYQRYVSTRSEESQ